MSPSYPYPLWTLALMFPLVLVPFEVSTQVWLVCNLVLLAVAVVGIFWLLDWPRRPAVVVGVSLLAGLYTPTFLVLWMGQTVLVSQATLVLLALAVRDERWMLAGLLAGIGLFKPQLVAPVSAAVLAVAIWRHRWRAPVAFAGVVGLLILLALPLAATPSQIFGGGAAEHVQLYLRHTSSLWGLLLTLFPVSLQLPTVVCGALGLYVLYEWFNALRTGHFANRATYLIGLTTVVTLLILPYSWSYNHAVLLLPLAYMADIAWKLPSRERLVWLCAVLAALLTPAIVYATIVQQQRSDVYTVISVLVILPLLVALQRRAERQAG